MQKNDLPPSRSATPWYVDTTPDRAHEAKGKQHGQDESKPHARFSWAAVLVFFACVAAVAWSFKQLAH